MAIAVESEKRSLWHHPNFPKLWASETISQFGTQFSALGIPFTAALLHATELDYGILFGTAQLPFALFALFVGVYVDRHHRKRIMVTANIGRGILLGLVPISFVTGWLTRLGMPLLYTVSFLVGLLSVFFDVSYQAILPSLVERSQIAEGNRRLEASRSTAAVFGPSIAGIIVQIVTAPVAIAIDAMSYFGSASFLSLIRTQETIQETAHSVMHDLKEGLNVVLKNKLLRSIAGSTGTSNLFSNALFAAAFGYLVNELGFTAGLFGLIFTLGSTGALLGVVLSSRVARRVGVGPAIVGSMLLGGVGAVPYLVVGPSLGFSVFQIGPVWLLGTLQFSLNSILLMLAFFIGAFSSVVYNINQVSLRQAIVPTRLQGRMNASMRWIVWGTLPLGSFLGGGLGSLLGPRIAIEIAVFGGALAFLWVLLSPVRSLQAIPEQLE
jgi:MFS family permease